MSLLNEMLKNLDKKKIPPSGNVLITSLDDQKPRLNLMTSLLILITFVSLFCLMALIMHAKPIKNHPLVRASQATLPPNIQTTKTTSPRTQKLSTVKDNPTIMTEASFDSDNDTPPLDTPALVEKKMTALTPEEWHDEHLSLALKAMRQGDDEQSIKHLNLILTQFPASIEARENLAAIYLSQSMLDIAEDVLNEGLKFAPHNLRLSTLKSRVLVEQGQNKQALLLMKQFNPNMQKEPEYYALLAAILESLGQINEASTIYQSLLKLEPSNGQYWLGFGIALEHNHLTQQAIEAYQNASNSERSQPNVRSFAENRLQILQG